MDQPMKLDTGAALRTGAAFFVGYMLGRTRRTKLAAGIGLALVTQSMTGRGLPIGKGVGAALGGGPLGRVAGEVAESVAAAASDAFNARVERFADTLHDRTSALQAPGRTRGRDAEDDTEPEDQEEPEQREAPARGQNSGPRPRDEDVRDQEPEDEEPEDEEDAEPVQATSSGRPASRPRPPARVPRGRRQDRR